MNLRVLFALPLVLLAFASQGEPVRTPVPDARPVLLAALQSADGTAHGVLEGELADAIRGHFLASSPVYIDVTTTRRYAQAGCSRLQVLFWQDGVHLRGATTPRRQTIEFGIDYCLDGLPPRSRS